MMRYSLLKIVIFFGFLLSCNAQAQTIRVYVTVDWEGFSLEQENIEEMQNFRKKFPHIPMLQLLNPVYFLRNPEHVAQTAQIVRSTFLPIDNQGLHVHAWKSLVTKCEIPYQHNYSFADTDEDCKTGDCGYTVSLEYAYSKSELTKLISCSNDLLVKYGFNRAIHFRAGGWQLGPKLEAALEANGFVWDSSRIDANLLTTRWHTDSGMVRMVSALHAGSTPLDQPYALGEHIMEYPNNAGLADYTSTKEIVDIFNTLIINKKTVMVLGFHQETAADYLHRLELAIPQLEAIAKAAHVQLEWAR